MGRIENDGFIGLALNRLQPATAVGGHGSKSDK
jgi:hypothetical protein